MSASSLPEAVECNRRGGAKISRLTQHKVCSRVPGGARLGWWWLGEVWGSREGRAGGWGLVRGAGGVWGEGSIGAFVAFVTTSQKEVVMRVAFVT